MKKVILMACIMASLMCKAQFNCGISAGMGSYIKPVAALSFGYHLDNHFLLQTGFHTYANHSQPAFFNARFGREFIFNPTYSLNITAGSGYQLQSTDHKKLNKMVGIGGVELDKYIRDDGDLFIEVTQAGKYTMGTIGIKFYIVNR